MATPIPAPDFFKELARPYLVTIPWLLRPIAALDAEILVHREAC